MERMDICAVPAAAHGPALAEEDFRSFGISELTFGLICISRGCTWRPLKQSKVKKKPSQNHFLYSLVNDVQGYGREESLHTMNFLLLIDKYL